MTSNPSTKPDWLNDLSTVCQQCQKPDQHLAFIEEKNADGTVLVSDYHFCANCHAYGKTTSSVANYALFWNNTLSKRVDPKTNKSLNIPFDQRYSNVNTLPSQPSSA